MTRRYSAARPVSDPVASRNATIKMIQRCAKHQPQAETWQTSHRTDEHTEYVMFGISSSEGAPPQPMMSVKEIDWLYIDRKVNPTQPVPLVSPDWYFMNGEWRVWENPFGNWEQMFPPFPPTVEWFSLRPVDNAAEGVNSRDAILPALDWNALLRMHREWRLAHPLPLTEEVRPGLVAEVRPETPQTIYFVEE